MLTWLKQPLTGLDLFLNNNYRLVILKQTLLKWGMVFKFTIH